MRPLLFSGGGHARNNSLGADDFFLLPDTVSCTGGTQQGRSEGNAAMNIFTGFRMAKRRNVRVQR